MSIFDLPLETKVEILMMKSVAGYQTDDEEKVSWLEKRFPVEAEIKSDRLFLRSKISDKTYQSPHGVLSRKVLNWLSELE